MPGEFDFIKEIQRKAAVQSAADLVLGIGDDAAAWREQSGRESLITVDLLVEDVDFKLEYAPPRLLGHKALAVSLSDIAAMGGHPKFALLTLAIPRRIADCGLQIADWEDFFSGYFELAAKHGVALIGGDISSAPDRLTIDSVVIGHCSAGKAIRRDGAKIGDGIYVTGSVGASAAGLKLLIGGARASESAWSSGFSLLRSEIQPPEGGTTNAIQSAIRAHLKPEPRAEFGRRLGELGLASAMIDVSDGLEQDLAHICKASGTGAIVNFAAVPVADEISLVTATVEEAFKLAVSGGEDFELLFTADKNNEAGLFALAADCQLLLTRIGEVVSADQTSAVMLRRDGGIKPLTIRGYDHFAV